MLDQPTLPRGRAAGTGEPMTTCARGCCYTGLQVCARNRSCACHWAEMAPASVKGGALATYRDPTASQAIHNIDKERRGT